MIEKMKKTFSKIPPSSLQRNVAFTLVYLNPNFRLNMLHFSLAKECI